MKQSQPPRLKRADFIAMAMRELGETQRTFAVKVRAFELRAKYEGIELAPDKAPSIDLIFPTKDSDSK